MSSPLQSKDEPTFRCRGRLARGPAADKGRSLASPTTSLDSLPLAMAHQTASVFRPDLMKGKVAFVVRRFGFISPATSPHRPRADMARTADWRRLWHLLRHHQAAHGPYVTRRRLVMLFPSCELSPSLGRRRERCDLRSAQGQHRVCRGRLVEGDGIKVHWHLGRRQEARDAAGGRQANPQGVWEDRLCDCGRCGQLPGPTGW